ncbi:MerC domain-containing protein [bacterium]|nr:MerC domain-containing protein [bacterium]
MPVVKQGHKKNKKLNIDLIGICCSSLCAIHCLLTPILLVSLPSLGKYFENQWVHISFFAAMTALALWTILRHYKMHQSKTIFALLILGIAVTALGFLPPEGFSPTHQHQHSHPHNHIWEEACFIIGGLMLFIGHIMTIRKYKCWEGHCHQH